MLSRFYETSLKANLYINARMTDILEYTRKIYTLQKLLKTCSAYQTRDSFLLGILFILSILKLFLTPKTNNYNKKKSFHAQINLKRNDFTHLGRKNINFLGFGILKINTRKMLS